MTTSSILMHPVMSSEGACRSENSKPRSEAIDRQCSERGSAYGPLLSHVVPSVMVTIGIGGARGGGDVGWGRLGGGVEGVGGALGGHEIAPPLPIVRS